MKKQIPILLIILSCVLFQYCVEEPIDLTKSPPSISFAFDTLLVDLNNVDNPPIVAFVKSETGLESVKLNIITQNHKESFELLSVDNFFNNKAYTVSQAVTYQADFWKVEVSAIDLAGKKSVGEMPLKIINIINPPTISFSTDSIVYDEYVGGEIPNTSFTITSDAGLKKLEMFFATKEGQIPYGEVEEFTGRPNTYEFDRYVEYAMDMKGFIVKVTDVYNKIAIATLPFKYIEIPPPTISLLTDSIFTDEIGEFSVKGLIKATGGIQSVQVVRVQNDGSGIVEEILKTITFDSEVSEYQLDDVAALTDATAAIKIKVLNKIGKEAVASIPTFVKMQYVPELKWGSFRYNVGLSAMPGVYPLLSLKDMKTYSMDYYTEKKENTANIDMKLFIFYGALPPAKYHPSSMFRSGTYSSQFKDSRGLSIDQMSEDAIIVNDTKLRLMGKSFDFENATAASINSIPLSSINTRQLLYEDTQGIGMVIAFKTASTSTVGGDRIGLMKEIARIPVTPPQGFSAYAPSFVVSVFAIKFPKTNH